MNIFRNLFFVGLVILCVDIFLLKPQGVLADISFMSFDDTDRPKGANDVPINGGDGYPGLTDGDYFPGQGGPNSSPEGGIGTLQVIDTGCVVGKCMETDITDGAIYNTFWTFNYDQDGNYDDLPVRAFMKDMIDTNATWPDKDTPNTQNNQPNRMTFWTWFPSVGAKPFSTDYYGHNVEVGTYVRNITNFDGSSWEDGGNHYYHFLNIPTTGTWSKVVLNEHPNHRRGGSGATEWGNLVCPSNCPTSQGNSSYFQSMTGWYFSEPYWADSIDRPYRLDEISLYREPYDEDDDHIYNLTGTYVSSQNRFFFTGSLNKNDSSVPYEIRYAFDQNIHAIGFDNAIFAETIPTNNSAFYLDKNDVSVPPSASTVSFAIRRQGATLFSQLTFDLYPGTPATPDTTPPTDPTNPAASTNSENSILLSWTASTDNVGVAGYEIERCQGVSCSNFSYIATDSASPYTDTGLTASTTYRYRIRAYDAAGNYSNYSSVASATTLAPDVTPPTDPSNLQATATSSSQINLTWTASTDNVGIDHYTVERCTGTNCTTFTETGTTTTNSYQDTNLTASTTYRYRIIAYDAASNTSNPSNVDEATTQDAPPIPADLILGYNFDEGTGATTADITGNSNNGTLQSGSSWTTQGKYTNALTLDGSTGYVDVGNDSSLNLSSSFTLSAWIYPTSLSGGDKDIITKVGSNADYYLQTVNTDELQIGFYAGSWYSTTTSSANIPLNTWTHVSGVFDDAANTLTVYINGAQQGQTSVTASPSPTTNPLHIGMGWSGQNFQGNIDDVRIYNIALTQAEIQTDMNTPLGSGGGTGADTTPPTITETTAIPTYTKNQTPDYTFTTDEAGTIQYSGDCDSNQTTATQGSNTIILNTLQRGLHNNCTLTVTDSSNNQSDPLTISPFTVTYQSDANEDGIVNIFDYNLMIQNFGATSDCGNPSDTDNDCDVDIFDYSILVGDFGGSV